MSTKQKKQKHLKNESTLIIILFSNRRMHDEKESTVNMNKKIVAFYLASLLLVYCNAFENWKWCTGIRSSNVFAGCLAKHHVIPRIIVASTYEYDLVIEDFTSNYTLDQFLTDAEQFNTKKKDILLMTEDIETLIMTIGEIAGRNFLGEWIMIKVNMLKGPRNSDQYPYINQEDVIKEMPPHITLVLGLTSGSTEIKTGYPRNTLTAIKLFSDQQALATKKIGIALDALQLARTKIRSFVDCLWNFDVIIVQMETGDDFQPKDISKLYKNLKVLESFRLYLFLDDKTYNQLQEVRRS